MAEITSEVMRITPFMAKSMLERNFSNYRHLTWAKVNELADAMSAGEFRLTGEAIKFAKSGRLIDGQHRLHAVVKSGQTVEILVVCNLSDESEDVLDRGMKRTNGDMLGHYELKKPNIVAAMAGLVLACRAQVTPNGYPKSLHTQPHVIKGEVLSRRELYEHAARLGERAKRAGTGLNASAIGAFYILSLDKGHGGRVDEFLDGLITQANLALGDQRIVLLRLISNNKPLQTHFRQLAVIIRAFNAWQLGVKRHHVKSWQAGQAYPEIVDAS